MSKVLKITGFIIVEIILFALCILIGVRFNGHAQEKSPLTINKIALVNLDDGVEIEGRQKYYGVDFVGTINDNMEITGLERARLGLEKGLYAAYIIIPATFSENIESINGEPEKSKILYKINPNLEESVREQVVHDIVEFSNALSTNIEYVYLDAVLQGLHEVQNGADQLLENDLKDLKEILKFTENEMIVDPEYPEQKHVENKVDELDFSKLFQNMQTVFSDLSKEYKDSQDGAQKEYEKLTTSAGQIDKNLENLNKEIEKFSNVEDRDDFDLNSASDVTEFVNTYNTDLKQWKSGYDAQLSENMDEYMQSCNENLEQQVRELESSQKDQLKKYYTETFARSDAWNSLVKDEMDYSYFGKSIYDYAVNEIDNLVIIIMEQNSIVEDYRQQIIQLQDMVAALSKDGTVVEIPVRKNPYDSFNKSGFMSGFESGLNDAIKSGLGSAVDHTQDVMNLRLNQEAKKWFSEELSFYGAANSTDVLDYINSLNLSDEDNPPMSEQDIQDVLDYYFEPELQFAIQPMEKENEDDTETENPVNQKSEDQSVREKFLFMDTEEMNELSIQDLNETLEGSLLDPISSGIQTDYENLLGQYSSLSTTWNNVSNAFNGFTINSYGDEKNRNELQQQFNNNMKDIQNSTNKKGKEYISYVDEANKVNEKNLQEWEKTISNANKSTRKNVDDNIKSIKENRQTLNGENNVLMENVIGLLPYTKLGELENKQVYSYIVSPLEYDDLSAQKSSQTNSAQTSSEHVVEIQWVIIAAGIILCLLSGAVLVRIMRCRNKKLQKQDL